MSQNQFVIDLGDLKITDKQRKKINSAIHKAVAGELADIGTANEVVLVPIENLSEENTKIIFGDKFEKPFRNGIIVRGDLKPADIQILLKSKVIDRGGL